MKRILGIAVGLTIGMNNLCAMDLLTCCFGRENRVEPQKELDESSKEYRYQRKLAYDHPDAQFATISSDSTKVLSIAKTSIVIKMLTDKQTLTTYECSGNPTYAAFSSDGRKALIGAAILEGPRTFPKNRGFEVLDLVDGTRSSKYLDSLGFRFLAFTPDEERVIAVNPSHGPGLEPGINIVDYATGQIKHAIKLNDGLRAEKDPVVCYLRNAILYTLFANGRARRVEVNTYADLPDVLYEDSSKDKWRKDSIVKKGLMFLNAINASASNDKIAIITNASDRVGTRVQDEIRIHDLESGNIISTISPFKYSDATDIVSVEKESLWDLELIAISPNSKRVAFGARGFDRACCDSAPVPHNLYREYGHLAHFICIADFEGSKGTITHRIRLTPGVFSMAFSPDNRFILLKGERSYIIDAQAGTIVWDAHGYRQGAFSSDGMKAVVPVVNERLNCVEIIERKWTIKKQ